jgi:hypothetical protein
MIEWLWLAIPVCVIGFFFFVVVVACLWEKRPIQPYYVPAEDDEYEPSAVAERANEDAEKIGYEYGGLCHDGKGKLYRVRYDFWIDPDDLTIAVVGSGTIAKIPVNGVWLWSRLADGRILCTTNEIGEQDISGAVEQQTWPGFRLKALDEKHERRLTDDVEPFPSDTPMAGYFDILRRKADTLVAKGYARYLDDEQTVWRYTLPGAVRFYFVGTWVRPMRRFLRSVGLVRE